MFLKSLVLVTALGITRRDIKPEKGPIVLKGVTATVFTDRQVAGSRRIDPYSLVGCAMPSHELLGQKITVHCPDTGVTIEVPVVDVGPWNICDKGILKGERPQAERGVSCLKRYGYRARNRAGIDLTPALHKALRIPHHTKKFLVDITFPRLEVSD